MLALEEIKNWIKDIQPVFDHYYVGKLDGKKDNSLGVYDLKRASGPPDIALGGMINTKIQKKQVSVLIHGTKNDVETEKMALKLFECLLSIDVRKIGEKEVCFLGLLVPCPVPVDHDENGVAEYVIEFEIFYKKEE